jgi:hypothetical protein
MYEIIAFYDVKLNKIFKLKKIFMITPLLLRKFALFILKVFLTRLQINLTI